MNYCSNCGQPVVLRIPSGDNLPRHVCDHCDTIHYQNPNVVAGCIPIWENKILICKRAIDPQYGKWTLPAGFLENGETVQQGAMRETMEEATAKISNLELFGMFNITHVNQVYVMFRGQLEEYDFSPGVESLECKMVTEDEIPWEELAFPVVDKTLKLFLKDRNQNQFNVHTEDIGPRKKAG